MNETVEPDVQMQVIFTNQNIIDVKNEISHNCVTILFYEL